MTMVNRCVGAVQPGVRGRWGGLGRPMRGGCASLRAAALLALAFASSVAEASGKPTGGLLPLQGISVDARPIGQFHKAGQSGNRAGKLIWRGGLVLNSPASSFGGYSGLEISADGGSILAVSDGGTWLSAKLRYRQGALAGLDAAAIGPLLSLSKQRLRRGRDRDAEGLRLVSGTLTRGRVLVSFEQNQRIGLFRLENGVLLEPLSYLRPPMRLPGNKGLEAAAMLHGGHYARSVLAFAERYRDPSGHHRGWLWVRGRPKPVALADSDGFDITDAVGLPDGSVIVLERRFRWLEGVKLRLRLIDGDTIRPGAVLSGLTLLHADMRYEIDNMEGLAVHRDAQGKLVLTLISDNNFNPILQRTLLLQFELPDEWSQTNRPRQSRR